jgi:Reverse transcriptase (RNA-dependent DNA polymerase)
MCDSLNLCDPFRTLYPDRRDFTFVPRRRDVNYRSRIDYFIISDSLLDSICNTDIAASLQNSLFDHKAVTLELGEKSVKIKCSINKYISNMILKDDLNEYVVLAGTLECYLVHATNGNFVVRSRESYLEQLGNFRNLIRLAGDSYPGTERDNLFLDLNAAKENLNVDTITGMELDLDPLVFMETLLFMLKNDTIAHQAFIRKKQKSTKTNLIKRIRELKKDYVANSAVIMELERDLSNINDFELEEQLQYFSVYDNLTNEKITPAFLSIAKTQKSNAHLDVIKDNDGLPFGEGPDRNNYILDFYRNLYKLPAGSDEPKPSIESFLGEEICNLKIVRDSVLTEDERNLMDRDLSLSELDEAVKIHKTRSAPGPDGISNSFIKKFWHFLRIPLFNYAKFGVENGILSPSFKTAAIRLIPKKGDLTNTKNWRPISLLNCTYKVLSKALNRRLQKISIRVLSRAQKGFVHGRYIHECILNIVDAIGHANCSNIPGFVLALDMAKAFDTVQHEYMNQVYKFFGFGDKFIKLIETLTINRNAGIIWDDGTISETFDLGTGNGQGNPPSPLQFNFCIQILLFKLELDPRIKSVFDNYGPVVNNPRISNIPPIPVPVTNEEFFFYPPKWLY